MTRNDGRAPEELRPVKITPNYLSHPHGSCLIEVGKTRVVCSAMLEDTVPPFRKGSGTGWLTAEYSMLPASSSQRIIRERNKVSGRTHEIQRLIGRSLRNCLDLGTLGERSILIDCDVLDADGGTRTAAITGGYVAMVLAIVNRWKSKPGFQPKLKTAVAAVSVGIVGGMAHLDLDYEQDRRAEVDMNVVQTAEGSFVEVQGTSESNPFDKNALDKMLTLASKGISELLSHQRKVLG